VEHGTNLTFTMTPTAGYKVDYLLVNGEKENGSDTYTLYNIKANGAIAAYFKYTVEIPINEESKITIFSYSNIVVIENKDLVPVKQVEIMDMYGRLVWNGQTTGDRTEVTLEVAKGIYNVRLITTTNQPFSTKLIINH
jgi:hypothetical protein